MKSSEPDGYPHFGWEIEEKAIKFTEVGFPTQLEEMRELSNNFMGGTGCR